MPDFYLGWSCPEWQPDTRLFVSPAGEERPPFDWIDFPDSPNTLSEIVTISHKAVVRADSLDTAWALVEKYFPKPLKHNHGGAADAKALEYYKGALRASGARVGYGVV